VAFCWPHPPTPRAPRLTPPNWPASSKCRTHGGITLIDEIYLGLSHDDAFGQSALTLGDDVISINSFSKYFNMTGWRLGWLVVPEQLTPVLERLAQNLFICASTVAQQAALACFEPESLAEYERRRAEFKARRDYFIPALNDLGLTVPVPRWRVLRLGRLHRRMPKAGPERQLGLCFCRARACPCGHHAGARLWHRPDGPLCALFHRQLMAELQTAIARLKAWLQP
jgi:hypothetical protein